MALTARERRQLIKIERRLEAESPVLAAYLRDFAINWTVAFWFKVVRPLARSRHRRAITCMSVAVLVAFTVTCASWCPGCCD